MIIQIFEFKIQQTFTWWNLYKSLDFSKKFNLRRSCSKLFRNSSSDIKLGIKQHLNGLVWITHPFSGEKGIKNKDMLIYFLPPFDSQDLIVNSLIWLIHTSLYIGYENLVFNRGNILYLMTLSILITCLANNVWIL